MIAGKIYLGRSHFRVIFNIAAVNRVAAAASVGAGEEETRQFASAVIDRRDIHRWHQVTAKVSGAARPSPSDVTHDDYVIALARCISLIGTKAATSDDPAEREWAERMLMAIVEFRAGERDAFTRLAYANALAAGQVLL